MKTVADKEALKLAASKWRQLAGIQIVLIPILAWYGVDNWGWYIIDPIVLLLFSTAVPDGSRFAVSVLFSWSVLAIINGGIHIYNEAQEGHDIAHSSHHFMEFLNLYVIETGWESLKIVWQRRSVPDVNTNSTQK